MKISIKNDEINGLPMENHKDDLRLIAEAIIRELKYNSIHKHETKKDIANIIVGIFPTLLRNCHELGIMKNLKSMISITEDLTGESRFRKKQRK